MAFENFGSQNVFQNQDQKGAASLVGSAISGYGKAENLSQMALQNKQMEMQGEAQKREEYLKKAEAFGGEMHSIASLPPEQQAQAYAQARQGLIKSGIASPDQAPEQYDPQFVGQMAMKYKQMSPMFAEQKLKLSHANLMNAQAAQAGHKPETAFQTHLASEKAKDFAATQKVGAGAQENIDAIDDTLNTLVDYNKKSPGGTGAFSTLGGLTSYVSSDTQALDRKFKNIALEKMKTQFSGMSKAIDSDAERRFFMETNPNITNKTETNASILLGGKALALKHKAESDAQQAWVAQHGTMEGYVSPVMGKLTALVGKDGQMQLVPKDAQKQLVKSGGFKTVDQFAQGMFSKPKAGRSIDNAAVAADETDGAPPPAPKLTVKKGQVMGGYVYDGVGDPKDPKSWKKR